MVPTPAPQSAPNTGSTDFTNTTNEYEEALDRLQPLQPILRGFNHRNKNQHRHAAWWGPFGMLRRHVDKLVDELVDSAAAAAAAAKSKNKKRKRDNDDGRAEKKARDHLKWLRDVLVPKCYLSFSQLTADNQFATLGVVLLGALAQVNAACVRLIGEAAPEVEEQSRLSSTSEHASNMGATDYRDGPLGISGVQGGRVISRDEVARAEKLRRKDIQSKERGQSGKDESHDDDATSIEKQQKASSKGKAKMDDVPSEEIIRPPKKKKKIKKGGDEFDDLFKGLF
ncbi:hypothetical protein F5Y06DRAFT_263192 [Hypoxylon sp. FL0890]|nr:hypothetical protein F5Y06DRAFT_263192 [Hypoxylon sp. FL0890]